MIHPTPIKATVARNYRPQIELTTSVRGDKSTFSFAGIILYETLYEER